MKSRENPASTKWNRTLNKVNSQRKFVKALQASDNSVVRTPERTLADRHIKEGSESHRAAIGRFRNAARKVHDVDPRRPTPQLQTVAKRLQELETIESGGEQSASESLKEERSDTHGAENHCACVKVREQHIEERVEKRLKESAEILIKKMAEIQYEENLRFSQETIRSTLERVSKTQERVHFMKSVEKKLRARLHQDLEFRSAAVPLITPQAPSQALVPVDHGTHQQQILQELSQEKEWREKADVLMKEQEKKMDHLRTSLQDEIKRVLQMQTKQFAEVKRLIDRPNHVGQRSPSDLAYVSLDVSTQSSSNRGGMETKRRNEPRKERRSEDWESEEQRSRSSSPGFYIQ